MTSPLDQVNLFQTLPLILRSAGCMGISPHVRENLRSALVALITEAVTLSLPTIEDTNPQEPTE